MPLALRRSVHLTIALIALVTVIASVITRFFVWERMERSVDSTMQAAQIEADLDEAFSLLQQAESAQRGYLLTGRDEFLAAHKEAASLLPAQIVRTEDHLRAYPETARDFAVWKSLSEARLVEIQATLDVRQQKGPAAALGVVEESFRKGTMNKIRTIVGRMKSVQNQHYIRADFERRRQTQAALLWTSAASISGVIAGSVALTLFAVAQRHARAEEEMERRAMIAEEVGKQKSAFLASMSHEIRTPMNAVLGFTELLESGPLSEKQQSHVFSIKQAGRSLVHLINDILDLSKVEAGMLELHPGHSDLQDIGEFVRTVIGQTCAKKGLDLRLDFPRHLPRGLILDEGRLRQILVNLAGNAARFTERGYVRIAAATEPSSTNADRVTVTLTVEDTGIGIPKENQERIFQPFTQVDGRRPAEKQGTGLGLSIVQRLTQLMGGSVRVKSDPGRGSTFAVVIPDVEISGRPPAPERAEAGGQANFDDFPASDVLVVDDNPANRDVLAGFFHGTRHRVRFATNGREALDAIEARRPDLVLMDVRMPVMTGTEVVQQLRSRTVTEFIPVIAVTASSLLDDEGTRGHFNAYLRKPFSRAELYCEMGKLIPRRHQTGPVALPALSSEVPDSAARAEAWRAAAVKLRQLESSTWRAVRMSLAITEAREFSDQLQAIAGTAECPLLHDYAELLRRHAGNFAPDELEKHFAAFPELIALIDERSRIADHS